MLSVAAFALGAKRVCRAVPMFKAAVLRFWGGGQRDEHAQGKTAHPRMHPSRA